MKKVCVLLSTYNGEKYLRELLDSVLAQEGIQLLLVVRDDGSKDGTTDILREYDAQGKIDRLMLEENVGFCPSFHRLMQNALPADYYAYCDQDDLWDKDKMLCAVTALDKESSTPPLRPLLYWHAFRSIDKHGKTYKKSSKRTKFKNTYNELANYLNCNDVRGCTCVFNQTLLDDMLTLSEKDYRYHDWMVLLLAVALGTSVYDATPHMGYRCHDTNCYGPFKFSLASLKRSIHYVRDVELKNNRSTQAREFYEAFGDRLDEKQRTYLEHVMNYQTDKQHKKALLKSKEIKAVAFPMRAFMKYAIRHNKY